MVFVVVFLVVVVVCCLLLLFVACCCCFFFVQILWVSCVAKPTNKHVYFAKVDLMDYDANRGLFCFFDILSCKTYCGSKTGTQKTSKTYWFKEKNRPIHLWSPRVGFSF